MFTVIYCTRSETTHPREAYLIVLYSKRNISLQVKSTQAHQMSRLGLILLSWTGSSDFRIAAQACEDVTSACAASNSALASANLSGKSDKIQILGGVKPGFASACFLKSSSVFICQIVKNKA